MSADALALLDSAAAVLRAAAPSLAGEGRYTALLSANAVALARREVATEARSDALRAAITVPSAAIRAGAHDDDAALYARLLDFARLRAWVTDPGALTPDERAAVEGAA